MFYLPDRVRPWENEYVERVIEFFAGAYGRPAKFTADASGTGEDYPGYPLVADAYLLWFFGGLPLLTVLPWRSRRPLSIPAQPINTGGQP